MCFLSLVTATLSVTFLSAGKPNESSLALAAAPLNTWAPESFSPWNSAFVRSTPAVIVGTEAGPVRLELHDLVGRAVERGARSASASPCADSCWNVGIMMIPTAPFFAA